MICSSVGLLAAAGMSVACTPEFNWRESRSVECGFTVLLPGRPASMRRAIDLDGLRVTMTMTGARVDRSLFTVGAIRLEAGDPALRERLLAAMRVAMLRNIRAAPQVGESARVAVLNAAGAPWESIEATALEAAGQAGGEPVVLQALFAGRSEFLWQAVAITPAAQVGHGRTMLESFRVLAP